MERLGMAVILTSVVVLVLGFHAFGCDKHELDALMELKSAINHPNGTALADWRKDDGTGRLVNCCHWDEVACSYGGRGPVFSLDLIGVRQEEWYMNASLFLPFTHLEDLYLSENSITGWTPHLRRLRSLQSLYLSGNRLQGIIDVYDLEALENLQVLFLDYNMINGFKRSRENLSTTNKLEALSLSDANISFYSLPLFPYVKELYLSNNDLGSIQNYVTHYRIEPPPALSTLDQQGSCATHTGLVSMSILIGGECGSTLLKCGSFVHTTSFWIARGKP